MKSSSKKKNVNFSKANNLHRPSIVSNFSVLSASDITDESLEVWKGLPEEIKQDPSLASFKRKNETLFGKTIVHMFETNSIKLSIYQA
jgi:hypothetical protein